MKILPSLNDDLQVTLFKVAALLGTAPALIAIAVLLPAGGHPPGVVFVPMVAGIWLMLMLVLTAVFFSLKLLSDKGPVPPDTHIRYTVTIAVAGIYFLYLLLDSIYRMMPVAIYTVPGHYTGKIVTLVVSYVILAGTVQRRKWARIATIIVLLIPMLLLVFRLISVDGRIGGMSLMLIRLMVMNVISIWIVYAYLTSDRIKTYFSG